MSSKIDVSICQIVILCHESLFGSILGVEGLEEALEPGEPFPPGPQPRPKRPADADLRRARGRAEGSRALRVAGPQLRGLRDPGAWREGARGANARGSATHMLLDADSSPERGVLMNLHQLADE